MKVNNYDILAAIEVELAQARAKFPDNVDIVPALAEEFGELNQALIQHKHEPEKGKTHVDIFQEAVQVAVMAIRIATEGDPHYPYDPQSGYRGAGWPGYRHDTDGASNNA